MCGRYFFTAPYTVHTVGIRSFVWSNILSDLFAVLQNLMFTAICIGKREHKNISEYNCSVRENEFRVKNNQKKDMYVAFFKSAHNLLTLILHDSK